MGATSKVSGVVNPAYERDKKGEHDGQNTSEKDSLNHEELDDHVDLSCGLGKFRTAIFGKWFSNLYVFTLLISISAVAHSMVWGVIDIHIISLQRQFNIDASQTALFNTAARAGYLLTILIPGHFAKRSNIPFMIGVASVLQGIVLSTPAFLQFARPYELPIVTNDANSTSDTNRQYLCLANDTETNSTDSTTEVGGKQRDDVAYFCLIAIQILKGLIEPFCSHSLVNIYLDDNTLDKSKMAIFFGIHHIIIDLASPMGKAINGWMTNIPVDLKDTAMNPKDQRFVAAWWLGFISFGLTSALFAFPVLLFPRRLVSAKQQAEALTSAVKTFAGGKMKESEKEKTEEKTDLTNKVRRKSKLEAIYDYERRRSSTVLTADETTDLGLHLSSTPVFERQSSVTYSPDPEQADETNSYRRLSDGKDKNGKLTQSKPEQVRKSDTTRKPHDPQGDGSAKHLLKDFPKALLRLFKNPIFVVIIIDIFMVSVPISGTGLFRSMYVSREFNVPMMDVAFAKGIMLSLSSVSGTLISTIIASRMKTKYGYMWIMLGTYIISTAVMPLYLYLGCDDYPVYGAVGEIGRQVNSSIECACDMGKQLLSCGSDGKIYYSPCVAGCEHVEGQTFSSCTKLLGNSTESTVSPGLCETPCYTNFIVYIALHGVQYLVSTMAMVPRKLLMIRAVDPRDRGFASSVFSFFWNVLAIPSPNLFGHVIDSACHIKDGNVCTLYNRTTIRYIMGGIDLSVHVVITINIGLMMFLSRAKDRRDAKKKEAEEKKINDSGPGTEESTTF